MLEEQIPVSRLTRDLVKGASTLGAHEVRFLVDAYYMMQEDRKRTGNQSRALEESKEPHALLDWFFNQNETLEGQIKRALGEYVDTHPVGEWMIGIRGIGPVIGAGLLAHIDITKAPTVGHIWRFAGLDSTVIWPTKSEVEQWLLNNTTKIDSTTVTQACDHFGRRPETILKYMNGSYTVAKFVAAFVRQPWNAQLKTLCWKIGESFVKSKGHEEAYYGHLYDQRKAYEHERNERLEYKDQAARILVRKPNHAQRKIYEAGKLSDGHLHSRAKRYAVKLFLAHLHEVWYTKHFKVKPPKPYAIEFLGHAHYLAPPNT